MVAALPEFNRDKWEAYIAMSNLLIKKKIKKKKGLKGAMTKTTPLGARPSDVSEDDANEYYEKFLMGGVFKAIAKETGKKIKKIGLKLVRNKLTDVGLGDVRKKMQEKEGTRE